MKRLRREDGVALLVALMALVLLGAIGSALIVSSSSETTIAAHFRNGIEARYAAQTMLERGIAEFRDVDDWSLLTGGVLQSESVDGSPAGPRTLTDGAIVDLTQLLNLASCDKSMSCTQTDMAGLTVDRPWGENNPQWRLYAYGRLRDLMAPATIDSPFYVVLFVGNGPTGSLLAARAEAFGPLGAHAVVEATAGRSAWAPDEKDYNEHPGQGRLKVLSWREVR
jgi:hypothetical protein